MSFERETTCHDFARRFDGFLDGELDPHSLRAMALHASHCPACGQELERAESLQALALEAVESEAERVDPGALWKAIESEISVPRRALGLRSWKWLDVRRFVAPIPALAFGGLVAALLAFLLWPTKEPTVAPTELADNHAHIDRIESSAPHVAVWSEPHAHTTAIWVASYEPGGAP
jgi:anti-sigma factor RsiW